ncbi:MAG: hypothetical protein LBE84_01455, partial [Planctomycetota bacterium]|nr:hypothetical protein [Planctomycetota bacterium]
ALHFVVSLSLTVTRPRHAFSPSKEDFQQKYKAGHFFREIGRRQARFCQQVPIQHHIVVKSLKNINQNNNFPVGIAGSNQENSR